MRRIAVAYAERTLYICGVLPAKPKDEATLGLAAAGPFAARLTFHAVRDGVFVHEQGLCESETVGPGTRVWAFAHVLPGARVGRDCNICDGVFVLPT